MRYFSLAVHFSDGWDRSFFDTGYDDYRGGYGGRKIPYRISHPFPNALVFSFSRKQLYFFVSFYRWWWGLRRQPRR